MRVGNDAPELSAQLADLNVDDIASRIALLLPDLLDQAAPANHMTRMKHEVLQHPELERGQGQFEAVCGDAMAQAIDLQRSEQQRVESIGAVAPLQGARTAA